MLASIRHYCLFLKDIGWRHTAYINNSDPGHTLPKQQMYKNLKINFASPSKNAVEKKKENNGKAFLVARKHKD